MKLVEKKLRVLHYANVPCTPFFVDVKDEFEAKKICNVLADQHLFLFENGFIDDYSNVICVVMLDEDSGEWEDYYNYDELMEWDEFEETYLKN